MGTVAPKERKKIVHYKSHILFRYKIMPVLQIVTILTYFSVLFGQSRWILVCVKPTKFAFSSVLSKHKPIHNHVVVLPTQHNLVIDTESLKTYRKQFPSQLQGLMYHVVQDTARLLNYQYYCTFWQLIVAVAQTEMLVHHVPVDYHLIGKRQVSLASQSLGALEKLYSVRVRPGCVSQASDTEAPQVA